MAAARLVHHVTYCVEPADLAATAAWFRDALGVQLDEIIRPDLGLHVLLSFADGIEVVAPLDEPGTVSAPIRAHLDAHGPGVYTVVAKVADLDGATTTAVAAGAEVLLTQDESNPEWDLVFREATLRSPQGLPLTLLETNLP